MKTVSNLSKSLFFFMMVAFGTITASAIDYQETMAQQIAKMYQTQNRDSLTNLAATFSRIGNMYPNEWLPSYYASYCYVSMTFNDKDADRIHATLDQAQQLVETAMKIAPKESELFVLQALIYSMRITDAGKGYKYSTLSNEALAQAQVLNENNPRIYFCKGQNVLHTPAMFGGGKGNAIPLFEKAQALFDTQKPTNPLMPMWGSQVNSTLLASLKQ